jgi:hypothetical protein
MHSETTIYNTYRIYQLFYQLFLNFIGSHFWKKLILNNYNHSQTPSFNFAERILRQYKILAFVEFGLFYSIPLSLPPKKEAV